MKSRRSIVFGLLGLCALASAPLPAAAQSKQCLPLKRVMRSVSQQYGARVLDAGSGGEGVYVIRLLTNDGRVLDVVVDCATGQVLGVRGN
jgi:uncharacterized membrane protein YkoI